MKSAEVKRICGQAFDQLAEALEQGRSPQLLRYLRAMGMFHRYSLANSMLIFWQKPEATHVAGFGTWRKLGRHVKKGMKGIAIMAPVLYRRSKKHQEEGPDENEDEEVFGYRTVYVFDVSQTSGRPLAECAQAAGDPGLYMDRLKQLVAQKGIELSYSEKLRTCHGYSAGGRIVLNSQLQGAEAFSTLVHEMAHELLHRDDSAAANRTIREIEAEAVAFVVCAGIGLEMNTASSDYIQLYDGEKEHLMKSLGRIQGTAAEILDAITAERKEEQPLVATAA
ncbi:MAG: DUF1738 domain-containing protein [Phycisphaerae bacterium]|nr:DUF1738 domain-containing protein [Phycisphaerae bacterium]